MVSKCIRIASTDILNLKFFSGETPLTRGGGTHPLSCSPPARASRPRGTPMAFKGRTTFQKPTTALNGYQVIERTQFCDYLCYKGDNLKKKHMQELWFLCMTLRRLNVLYKCMKFRRNICNGYQVIERTRFCDGQTDTQTNRHTDARGKTICLPTLAGGRH